VIDFKLEHVLSARETLETSQKTSRTHNTIISYAALAIARLAQEIAKSPLWLPRTSEKLLLIRCSDDILPSVRLGQHARRVWEPLHQAPIKDSGGDEGVDVADGEAAYWSALRDHKKHLQ
jgi:hypothetical protein